MRIEGNERSRRLFDPIRDRAERRHAGGVANGVLCYRRVYSGDGVGLILPRSNPRRKARSAQEDRKERNADEFTSASKMAFRVTLAGHEASARRFCMDSCIQKPNLCRVFVPLRSFSASYAR